MNSFEQLMNECLGLRFVSVDETARFFYVGGLRKASEIVRARGTKGGIYAAVDPKLTAKAIEAEMADVTK